VYLQKEDFLKLYSMFGEEGNKVNYIKLQQELRLPSLGVVRNSKSRLQHMQKLRQLYSSCGTR